MTAVVLPPEAPPFGRDRMVHAFVAVSGVSRVGDAIWNVALVWAAVHLASAATAGLVIAAGTVPRALVVLYGGVLADRVDALRIMRLTNLARAAVLLAMAALAWSGRLSVAPLLVFSVAFGVADALYLPASSTLPRQLLRSADLPAFQGVTLTVQRLSLMGGAAAGGVLVAVWGVATSAVLDAATFVIQAVFLTVLRPRFPLERDTPEPTVRALRAGFRHLRDAPATRMLVLTLSGLNLAVGPALNLGIALRATAHGWGPHMVGLSDALVALGGAVGALSMVRFRPRRVGVWGFGMLVVQGLCIVLLGTGGRALVAGVCVVLGITAGAASALLSAVFMATVEQAYLGRMSSLMSLGDDVLMPAAMAAFGALAAASTTSVPFAVYGGAMTLLMLLTMQRRPIRALRLTAGEAALE